MLRYRDCDCTELNNDGMVKFVDVHYQTEPNLSFLPRDALVHSAVLRLHVVRQSVCLTVTLVDQDHIGWKSWKLIARTISPTPSLFVAQKPPSYSQRNIRKFWGD